jgi:hypothetical protein
MFQHSVSGHRIERMRFRSGTCARKPSRQLPPRGPQDVCRPVNLSLTPSPFARSPFHFEAPGDLGFHSQAPSDSSVQATVGERAASLAAEGDLVGTGGAAREGGGLVGEGQAALEGGVLVGRGRAAREAGGIVGRRRAAREAGGIVGRGRAAVISASSPTAATPSSLQRVHAANPSHMAWLLALLPVLLSVDLTLWCFYCASLTPSPSTSFPF